MLPDVSRPLIYISTVLVCLVPLGLGLRGVITRKPFLVSARWVLGIVLVGLLPLVLQPLNLAPSSVTKYLDRVSILFICILIAGFIIVLAKMPFYTVLGITDDSLDRAIKSALERLHMPYTQNVSHNNILEKESINIYLPLIRARLRVAKFFSGEARITIQPHQFDNILHDIAKEMSTYYQTENVSANLASFYYWLFLGGICLAVPINTFY